MIAVAAILARLAPVTPIVRSALLPAPVIAAPVIAAPLLPTPVIARLLTARAHISFGSAGLFLGADGLALVTEIIDVVELIEIITLAPLLRLIVGPAALIGEHTEIMVRELQIIFGVDTIARHLRVARHILVFFQQLCRIAARAAVDPVAAVTLSLATATLALTTTTAATATVLTVVDQTTVLVLEPKPASVRPGRPTLGAGCSCTPAPRLPFGTASLP
jgi:hypothetical protein